jgi:hypothetical protein
MSAKHWISVYQDEISSLIHYLDDIDQSKLRDPSRTLAYEAAVVRASVALEKLMFRSLVGVINKDSSELSRTTGVTFPKHVSVDVAAWLVVGNGYFDWKGGRAGLIRFFKQYLPSTSWLLAAMKDIKGTTIDVLIDVRNWAAHDSERGRKTAQKRVNTKRVRAGTWLREGKHLRALLGELEQIGYTLDKHAPS